MPTFPSPEWVDAYRQQVGADEDFHREASGWDADIGLVVEADPARGVPEDTCARLGIHPGAVEASSCTPDEAERTLFVLRAPYMVWKDVLSGRLDPRKGMTEGRLRVAGDVIAVREKVGAVSALVAIARRVPTDFPDEVA